MDGRYFEGKCGYGANCRRDRCIGLRENDCISILLGRVNGRRTADSPRKGSGEQKRLCQQ
jgi:hypothetical protein